MRVVLRRDTAALRRALGRASQQEPTWRGDASSASHPGFHTEVYQRELGSGEDTFAKALTTIMTWGVQRGAGLDVVAADELVRVGTTVVVGLPIGPLLVLAPCRVTDVFDTPQRGGFRYVTLPGHPEVGFEEFAVERSTSGKVTFVVRPVSRPGSVITRLGGPVARHIQQRAGRRYLGAIRA
jgi:uncharacterized protein (UPF0548 family)